MLEGVTIEQLRTLRAVAEAGTFTAAARKLGRVQAAVSQAIDRLEAQLGLRLFDRSGRVPRLTAHGEAVVAAATRVEGDVDALEDLVAGIKQGAEASLSIVVDAMFPTAPLVAFAKGFAREHPSVALVLFTDVLSGVTAHVRDRHASWGIAVEDADMKDLDRRAIAELRLVPVVASTHPLALAFARAPGGSLDAAGLADAVQIVLGRHKAEGPAGPRGARAPRDDRDDRGDRGDHGVFSPRTWRVVDLATKHALIAGGLGWGHMPEHLVRDDLRAGRLVALRLDAWGPVAPRRALVLVWRRGAVIGPVARAAQSQLAQLCLGELAPDSAPPSADHHTR
jgi:DNA-binding transcriptional LysR family regulator